MHNNTTKCTGNKNVAASKWSGENGRWTREQQIATAFSEATQTDLFAINMYKYVYMYKC